YLLTPIAGKLGLMDQPSGRKKHVGMIPLVGGIAIWLSLAICLLFIGITPKLLFFVIGGGLLALVGAIDDATDMSPTWRLVVQITAALIMCLFGGVVVRTLGDIVIPGIDLALGFAAIPFTVFAVVALVNAVNMCDGIDGHCGTQVFIPLAGLTILVSTKGDTQNVLPLLIICGCILGFLLFNMRTPWRSKASVFLGDAGSNLLGFALAWFLIDTSQGPDAVMAPVGVLWFALLLIYDTVEVVARRVVRRKSPFEANDEHLHHVFLLAGFSVSETVLTMGGISLLGVLVGFSATFFDVPDSMLFAAFVLFGLLFLRMIFRTWSVMQFLYRSICRRRGERRTIPPAQWGDPDRRTGSERRKDWQPATDTNSGDQSREPQ
ncbi:MAG: MraY family glycosyltransferase, partial [Woeseiaceae bacterium]